MRRARPDPRIVQLTECLDGSPAFAGKPVSVALLILFSFPAEWAGRAAQEIHLAQDINPNLRVGTNVCVAPNVSAYSRTYIARVERTSPEHGQMEVSLMHVLPQDRHAPWQARKWSPWPVRVGFRRLCGEASCRHVSEWVESRTFVPDFTSCPLPSGGAAPRGPA